jgi:hypothetical protein
LLCRARVRPPPHLCPRLARGPFLDREGLLPCLPRGASRGREEPPGGNNSTGPVRAGAKGFPLKREGARLFP